MGRWGREIAFALEEGCIDGIRSRGFIFAQVACIHPTGLLGDGNFILGKERDFMNVRQLLGKCGWKMRNPLPRAASTSGMYGANSPSGARRTAAVWLFIALLGILTLGSYPVAAFDGSLSGTVTPNVAGPPVSVVPDAAVRLQGGPTDITVNTNSSGQYSFPSVAAGFYVLTVTRVGFQTWSQSVTIGDAPLVQDASLTSLISLNAGAFTVTPNQSAAGSAVTLGYSITNNAGGNVDVTLGGFFAAPGTTSVAFADEANNFVVSVAPRNRHLHADVQHPVRHGDWRL